MLKKIRQFENNNQGVVLLITLMILTVMMVSVLALSRIIINEVKSTRNADNAINAFYAAESGVEQGLYALKKARLDNNFANFVNLVDEPSIPISDSGQSFIYNQASTTQTTWTAENIATTSVAAVNLIEPGADISFISNQFNCYQVSWSVDNCFPAHGNDRLEITHTSLAAGLVSSEITKHVAVCNCSINSNNQCGDYLGSDISGDKFYNFTFRPLDDTVSQIDFYARQAVENCQNSPSLIPSEATIRVTGNYRRSAFTISATKMIFNPLGDLFSYVLFSEEEICKLISEC